MRFKSPAWVLPVASPSSGRKVPTSRHSANSQVLDSLLPEWQDSLAISLLMERESLAAMIVAIVLLLFLIALRVSLRWYGEKYLHAYSVPVREQLRRAYQAFFSTAS
jgi:hypothetical protein